MVHINNSLNSTFFIVLGLFILGFSVFKLFQNINNAKYQFKWTSCIDVSTFFFGLGLGGLGGFSGAFLCVLYIGVARLLAYLSLNQVCAYARTKNINELSGISNSRPLSALLFAFSMFAAIGISPFLTPDAKPLIMYAVFETNQPMLSLILVISNIISAIATVRLVQPIWLGLGTFAEEKQSFGSGNNLLTGILSIALILMGIFGHSLVNMAVSFSGYSLESLPHISVEWNFGTLLLFVSAFALFFLRKFNRLYAYAAGGGILALTLVCALTVQYGHPLSRLFACIISGIGLLVWSYSYGYFAESKKGFGSAIKESKYTFFFFILFGSLFGLATTSHSLSFFVFWELMTLSSYVLIAYQGTEAADKAAKLYFIMCTAAATFLLPVLLYLSQTTGSFNWAEINASIGTISGFALSISAFSALIAFGVKAGLMPGHAWLPVAHPAAPSSISAPLSGVLTKAGIFGIVLLIFLVMGAANTWQGESSNISTFIFSLLTLVGATTMAYGEFMALKQEDIKRLFAYSTMGQIGEITLTLSVCSLLATTGALFHVLNHAIMKDLLFLGSGALILRAGGQKLSDFKGLGRVMPFTVTCMVIGLLSIMGLPPFAGFMSKYLMIMALSEKSMFLAALMLMASLAGCVYYMRIIRVLVFEPCNRQDITEVSLAIRIPLGILAGLCILLGLFPNLGLSLILPIVQTTLNGAELSLASLPPLLKTSWSIPSLILLLGGVAICIKRPLPILSGKYTTLILLATSACVLLFGRSLDTLSFIFALIIPLVGAINMHYATDYMLHSHSQWRFYGFFLFMCAGLVGVALSSDLFNFFFFWEIMSSWSLYFVIVHEENEAALREGFKYFFFNVLGASFIFLAIAFLSVTVGTVEFSQLPTALAKSGLSNATITGIVTLLAIGFIMKAAQLPFRIDIQMHPATAPTPVSGYISSVLLKSALFGLIKLFLAMGGVVFFTSMISREVLMEAVLWIGGITIVMAAAYAVVQTDIKRMLIYSTVSQLGYMVLALALCTPLGVAGGLLHLLNHVLFKNLLFLVAGALILQTGKHSLNEIGGLGRQMPKTFALFAIGAFCVIGIPPSNGFTSKWIIYHALMEQGYVLLAILSLVGSVITLAYFAKFMHTAFLGQSVKAEKDIIVTDPPKGMILSMNILAVGCIITSIFPGIFLAPINMVLEGFNLQTLDIALWGISSGSGAWNATITAVLFFVVFFGARYLLLSLSTKQRITDIHTCGIPPEELNLQENAQSLYSGPISIITTIKQQIAKYFKQ
ncbi:NADH:ubiquinone oxidoreductase subunit 5 (chain L)/Multisubunit Na+/H+ antiporter, MnhA subunit [Desulfovibrio litoralis DSM 11393]|uniref:NADH:ubiquinone oxidoreductase subunit 5 (Chain L)/Multisubunit Na+/H+ antiporter, MnhA subunit n=2 Tax=Desulfovibrio litoralis TaxID=466107 RepID=A0A1M7S1G6_9BACT|nr:proton-conducting transporter membrane subunit [Desulfovibrio litoralis]SHN52301.1 NADH:ubiquinone oxidoreductase subunit 5 (chain L)/Multisubunit Na+/H+ antiporter, MnhA subunit [Desulfovibrio litoralis DSM 11393]